MRLSILLPSQHRGLPLPVGTTLVPFRPAPDSARVHAIFAEAYANGDSDVALFAQWWAALQADPEYDPSLVLMAEDADSHLAAALQGWTSGYIKDLVVASRWRGKGLGRALLTHAFARFHATDHVSVDLKVRANNHRALVLYRGLGMVTVVAPTTHKPFPASLPARRGL